MLNRPTPPLSRFAHGWLAEQAKLTAQRKLARAEATARRIRREAHSAAIRAQALTLRQDGATYAAIGQALGISQARAKQIVSKAERRANNPHWADTLPTRAASFLKRACLLDLSEAVAAAAVAKLSRREVLSDQNVGKGAVAAMAEWLARHGHTFSSATPCRPAQEADTHVHG